MWRNRSSQWHSNPCGVIGEHISDIYMPLLHVLVEAKVFLREVVEVREFPPVSVGYGQFELAFSATALLTALITQSNRRDCLTGLTR
jgi:hypothetical protein